MNLNIKSILEERNDLESEISAKIKTAVNAGRIPSSVEGLEDLLNRRSRLTYVLTNSSGDLAS
ncbi:MAG: hypothetical protein AAB836_00855 [Patescibacteria group bacterium]